MRDYYYVIKFREWEHDGGYSYLYKQPDSPEEEAQCKEAMEGCPVEAIGNGGPPAA